MTQPSIKCVGPRALITTAAAAAPVVRICGRGDAFLATVVRRLVRVGPLTQRMAQAVDLYVQGWPPDAAAREMRCSLNTYRNHISSAFRRVGADAHNELFRVVANDLDASPIPLEFEPR